MLTDSLRTKFLEAAGFEEQYYELLERQEILECREAVAIEQAERVAMENAELMGHTDGSSRIGYVDGVRREMAMCRQVSMFERLDCMMLTRCRS